MEQEKLENDGERVALVLEELSAQMGEIRGLLREVIEALYSIPPDDEALGQAVERYNRKINIARGGPL